MYYDQYQIFKKMHQNFSEFNVLSFGGTTFKWLRRGAKKHCITKKYL